MADGTAWRGRRTVTAESQRGSLPLSVAKLGGMGLLGVVTALAMRVFRSVRIRYSPKIFLGSG